MAGVVSMSQCHRCDVIVPDCDITIVIHNESQTVLGEMCDVCVTAWFDYMDYLNGREEE